MKNSWDKHSLTIRPCCSPVQQLELLKSSSDVRNFDATFKTVHAWNILPAPNAVCITTSWKRGRWTRRVCTHSAGVPCPDNTRKCGSRKQRGHAYWCAATCRIRLRRRRTTPVDVVASTACCGHLRGVSVGTMLWRGTGPCGHSGYCFTCWRRYSHGKQLSYLSFANKHRVSSIHNNVIRDFMKRSNCQYLSLALGLLVSCCSSVEDRMHLFPVQTSATDFAKKTLK